MCIFSYSANARDYSPAGIAKEMGIKPIEEYYPKDKNGCAQKAAYFVAIASKYKNGVSIAKASRIRMFEPLIEHIYKKIRDVGMDKALLDNMVEYSDCIDKAETNMSPEREYDLALVHNACKKLNDILIGTVTSIKSRRNMDSVIRKYVRKPIDFYGTQYEKINDAEILFIGQLFKASQDGSYSDVVNMASNLSVGCYR